jgi:Uma2 family endonuclease
VLVIWLFVDLVIWFTMRQKIFKAASYFANRYFLCIFVFNFLFHMTASATQSSVLIDKNRRYTVEEYLDIERKTNQKHIFLNGKIIPMAGANPPHLRISGNVFFQLYSCLEARPEFEVLNSDTKIYMPQLHIYHYPDALVVAGKPEFASEEVGAILNPILIIEVLSGSTGRYDRGQKFTEYQTLPSFKEYVLIHQDRPQIDTFLRQEDPHLWRTSEFSGIHSDVYFQSIDVKVSFSKIYRNVSFETAD